MTEPARHLNYARNGYHAANAILIVVMVEWVLTSWGLRVAAAIVVFTAAWTLEISRRVEPRINTFLMWLFSSVAHPHEANQPNSATWYTTAGLVLLVFFPLDAAVVGIMVLGLGDPAAAIVGRRWGRTTLRHGRSLEGSLAFVGAAFLGAWAVLALCHEDAGPVAVLAAAAAVGGAVGEIVVRRIDDNLSIPLVAATAMVGVRSVIG